MDNFVPSKFGTALTKGLVTLWEKLGKPTDCSTNTGWVLMDNIMQVWERCWPQEKDDWISQIKGELSVERSVQEAIKADGGYFPMSYPTRLYELIKAMMPAQKMNDRWFIKGMVERYPFLKTTNYKI